jgi:hypothetical protein
MPAPYDYASTLGGATGIAPSVQAAITSQQQIEGNKQALASQALQLQLAEKQAERQQQMQRDFAILANNPTAAGYAHFMTLYPEAHDALGKAWDALDQQQRQATLRTTSDVYARIQSGDVDGAVAELQAHMDAAKAGGEDTSNYPALIEAIKTDPKKAAALTGMAISSAVGSDKFAETFRALNPSDKQTEVQKEYDWRAAQFGKAAADSWLATQDTKLVPVQAGGQVYAYGPSGGSTTGPATGPQPKGGDQPTGVTVTPTGPAIEHAAFAAVPGVVVTSGLRSAEHNREVGGVRNSYHLTDQARDFVPPKGMPMAMLAARLKKALPGFDVLNEGTHIHVEPGPGMATHAGPVHVTTPQQAEGLAPGTHYVTPDGREFVR